MKKILCVLNYYYPYISGVSEYARVICEKMAAEGYDVTVLTSNHDRLCKNEVIRGVKVVRASVICKISKGTVSPQFVSYARKMAKAADVVWLNLPMLESGLIASIVPKEKLLCIYQCDVNLPAGALNNFIVRTMDFSHNRCLKRCRKILVTSVDYGKHSRLGRRYVDKLVEAGAPIKEYPFRKKERTDQRKTIGFCGRIVEEKGIDVLIDAFGKILEKRDDVVLKIGGDYESVAGGSVYPELIRKIEEQHMKNVEFLGRIPDEKMGDFYAGLDVFVLPSTNSLEAFGMVQVEAMICGTPVVASDLYGVRTIVKKTGMGVVVKRKDPEALAKGIIEVLDHPEKYIKTKDEILEKYGTQKCFETFEGAIEQIAGRAVE